VCMSIGWSLRLVPVMSHTDINKESILCVSDVVPGARILGVVAWLALCEYDVPLSSHYSILSHGDCELIIERDIDQWFTLDQQRVKLSA